MNIDEELFEGSHRHPGCHGHMEQAMIWRQRGAPMHMS